MESHLLIQLIYTFLPLENMIKFRQVCKSWNKLLTEKYPEIHYKFFDRKYDHSLSIGRNYSICMAEFQSGRYKLYPELNWYIRIKDSKVRLPIKLAKLAQLIANKYEPEMWQ